MHGPLCHTMQKVFRKGDSLGMRYDACRAALERRIPQIKFITDNNRAPCYPDLRGITAWISAPETAGRTASRGRMLLNTPQIIQAGPAQKVLVNIKLPKRLGLAVVVALSHACPTRPSSAGCVLGRGALLGPIIPLLQHLLRPHSTPQGPSSAAAISAQPS